MCYADISARGLLKEVLLAVLTCLVVFLAFGCSGLGATQEEEQAEATPPNIIFILTDDLDYASVQKMP